MSARCVAKSTCNRPVGRAQGATTTFNAHFWNMFSIENSIPKTAKIIKLYCKNRHFLLSAYFHIRSFLYAIWMSNWFDFRLKNHPKSPLGGLPGRLGAFCGRLGGVLGRLGGLLAACSCVEELSWKLPGRTWGRHGPSGPLHNPPREGDPARRVGVFPSVPRTPG